MRVPHPIETESYAILRARLDTTDLPPLTRAVVERVVHTTADPSWVGDLVCDEVTLRSGRAALRAGAPVITDVRMVAAGITSLAVAAGGAGPDVPAGSAAAGRAGPTVTVALDLAGSDPPDGSTRSAAGIRAAVRRHPLGAVWVIGNAPTALAELSRCAAEGLVGSPLVIGLPVGFVGAVAAKSALRAGGLPSVTNRSERGGAAVAAAAVNALLYAGDGDPDGDRDGGGA